MAGAGAAFRRLSEVGVVTLAGTVATMAEADAHAEIHNWLNRHGAQALADALPDAGDTGRGLAFQALLRHGTPARVAVESMRGHPELAAYAVVWLADILDLDRAALVRQPAALGVLDALGRGHPDKAVAKAARKALFKLRSAG